MKTTARPKKTAPRPPAARTTSAKAAARTTGAKAAARTTSAKAAARTTGAKAAARTTGARAAARTTSARAAARPLVTPPPAPARKPSAKHTPAPTPVAAVAAPRRPAASRAAPARVIVKTPAPRTVAAIVEPTPSAATAPAPLTANGKHPVGNSTDLRAPAKRLAGRPVPPRLAGRYPGASRTSALKQVKPVAVAEKTGCSHHWLIEPPNGAVSVGKCRLCGESREFRNSYEYSSWYGAKTPPKPGASAVPPKK